MMRVSSLVLRIKMKEVVSLLHLTWKKTPLQWKISLVSNQIVILKLQIKVRQQNKLETCLFKKDWKTNMPNKLWQKKIMADTFHLIVNSHSKLRLFLSLLNHNPLRKRNKESFPKIILDLKKSFQNQSWKSIRGAWTMKLTKWKAIAK
jgi:hypothetical protein